MDAIAAERCVPNFASTPGLWLDAGIEIPAEFVELTADRE
jgi:hypothetical protein